MNLKDYAEGARKTESDVELAVVGEFHSVDRMVNARLLHAAMGLCTEAGEIMDVLKRHVFYGKKLDNDAWINLLEEAGDVCWYLFGLLLDEVGHNLELDDPAKACLVGNLAKLQKRYGEKFSEFNALHREIADEINALKSKL